MKKIASTFLLALLFCIPANAQIALRDSLVLLFETEPGTRSPSLSSFFTDFDNGFDANGDGKPELILIRADSITGGVVALRVVDLTSNTTLWEVQDINMELGLDPLQVWKQLGFADPHGDGSKDAIFQSQDDLALIRVSDKSLSFYHIRGQAKGVVDVTGDGIEELILFLPDKRQVQVWGKKAN